MSFCVECGLAVRETDFYCTGCGAPCNVRKRVQDIGDNRYMESQPHDVQGDKTEYKEGINQDLTPVPFRGHPQRYQDYFSQTGEMRHTGENFKIVDNRKITSPRQLMGLPHKRVESYWNLILLIVYCIFIGFAFLIAAAVYLGTYSFVSEENPTVLSLSQSGLFIVIIMAFISIIPAIAISYFFFKKDKDQGISFIDYRLEIWYKRAVVKAFALGALIIIPVVVFELAVLLVILAFTLFFELFLLVLDYGDIIFLLFQLLIVAPLYAFVLAAIIEEGAKRLVLKGMIGKKTMFYSRLRIILFSVAIAASFSIIENVFYVFSAGDLRVAIITALGRAVTSSPGHITFGIIMGYYAAKMIHTDDKEEREKNNRKSWLYPILAHGIFNYVILATGYVIVYFWPDAGVTGSEIAFVITTILLPIVLSIILLALYFFVLSPRIALQSRRDLEDVKILEQEREELANQLRRYPGILFFMN